MSLASVAIIGRPNVGKSTLFNRIVGRHLALTDKIAGVTRDRHLGEAEWLGRSFRVIDTGGMVTGPDHGLMHAIREQTEDAIAEAELLLLVIDARQEVTHVDQDIALQLRKSDKRVLLVVNKAEAANMRLDMTPIYRLGFGEPFLISAEHGQGVGDLLDAVLKELPDVSVTLEDERGVQIAILGRPNVGKSSLINRILGQRRLLVDNAPGTTRDAIDSVVRVNARFYTLVDTAGMRKFRQISESLEKAAVAMSLRCIERCDVAVLLLDAVAGVGAQDIHIATHIERRGKACIIALNKWDAVEKTSQTYESFVQTIQEVMPFFSHAPIISLSALTGQRVVKLFPLINTVFAEAQRHVPTSQLNEFLHTVTCQHPAPMYRGRSVKFSFLVQTGGLPPTFCCFVNRPEGVTNFYRRYLENKLRQHFGFAGVPIRLRLRKK
jgi:GTP-binding protein